MIRPGHGRSGCGGADGEDQRGTDLRSSSRDAARLAAAALVAGLVWLACPGAGAVALRSDLPTALAARSATSSGGGHRRHGARRHRRLLRCFLRARRDDKLAAAAARGRWRSAPRSTAPRRCSTPTTSGPSSGNRRSAPPQVFGGLPERVGAPADKAAFLAFRNWLSPESAAELEAAADKLRRDGEAFQLAVALAFRRAAGGDRPHQRPALRSCASAS